MICRFLIIIFILLLNYKFAFAEKNISKICVNRNCRLIIDAGSSGTRAHLYSYTKGKINKSLNIEEIYVSKVAPGFASINGDKVGFYLTKLMQQIPAKNLDVYFYATAGMRLLSEEKQQFLYKKLNLWFANHPEWHLKSARTIKGSEEGVFGWIATNYFLGALDDNRLLSKLAAESEIRGDEARRTAVYTSVHEDSSTESTKQFTSAVEFRKKSNAYTGFIEVGGASTQIVFPITNFAKINHDDITFINIFGKKISLFSHSFLGLGAGQVFQKFKNLEECFPDGYLLPNKHVAVGDAKICEQKISAAINLHNYISDIVRPAMDNNPVMVWYNVGALSSISQKSPLSFKSKFSERELIAKVDKFYCKKSWKSIQERYPDDGFSNQNCLVSSFLYGLLVSSYGLKPDQIIHNLPQDKYGDWTIGALLQEI